MRQRHYGEGRRRLRRPGFTLVEAVISTLVVGTMFVAAMSTVAASKIGQRKVSVSAQGQLLAEALMAEILNQAYEDPDGATVFGPESGESTGTRADFDDVDDYHDWSASPPVDADGTDLTDADQWQRTVVVQWVQADDPSTAEGKESGVKCITVTVLFNGAPQASLVALKTTHQEEGL